jgi:hypothetical protein
MGAGYVVGVNPIPIITLSIGVGGPLTTTRAEAMSPLQLIRDVGRSSGTCIKLLIFADCLVLLDILIKWGRSDYYHALHARRCAMDAPSRWTGGNTDLFSSPNGMERASVHSGPLQGESTGSRIAPHGARRGADDCKLLQTDR